MSVEFGNMKVAYCNNRISFIGVEGQEARLE